ncbi:MAG TPA: VOC family protein [Candidatus Janibacter merdipullorum]|nr:VOC family protein [Candidatus Janibacter merdipullorum]
MRLENIAIDAVNPVRVADFWEAALGTERLTTALDLIETRLSIPGGPWLDICIQEVPTPPTEPLRLHLDLLGGADQADVVDRLLTLGARHLDIGQGEVPWVVLADVEGTPFCVMEDRAAYAGTGPIAALPLDSADPERDADFWSWLTGWVDVDGVAPRTLRHPSLRGPLLELCPEPEAKGAGKNRIHLDVRPEAGDDPEAVIAGIVERGGSELGHEWGDLPWRVFVDPSGNEFCVLAQEGTL